MPGLGFQVPLGQRLDGDTHGPGTLGQLDIITFAKTHHQVHPAGLGVDQQAFTQLLLQCLHQPLAAAGVETAHFFQVAGEVTLVEERRDGCLQEVGAVATSRSSNAAA